MLIDFRYTDNGVVEPKVLFQTRNLMRTALSPDQTKLIMSTSSGYIMVVHDLDINTIADDLNGFKVNICRPRTCYLVVLVSPKQRLYSLKENLLNCC